MAKQVCLRNAAYASNFKGTLRRAFDNFDYWNKLEASTNDSQEKLVASCCAYAYAIIVHHGTGVDPFDNPVLAKITISQMEG